MKKLVYLLTLFILVTPLNFYLHHSNCVINQPESKCGHSHHDNNETSQAPHVCDICFVIEGSYVDNTSDIPQIQPLTAKIVTTHLQRVVSSCILNKNSRSPPA